MRGGGGGGGISLPPGAHLPFSADDARAVHGENRRGAENSHFPALATPRREKRMSNISNLWAECGPTTPTGGTRLS